MLHFRVSSSSPILIDEVILTALNMSSSSSPSSSSSSSREKYIPATATSPLQRVKTPFTRNILSITPTAPRSRRRRTVARVGILLIISVILVSAVNEWLCQTRGCLRRTGRYGYGSTSSGAYVGGGSVIGRPGAAVGDAEYAEANLSHMTQEEKEMLQRMLDTSNPASSAHAADWDLHMFDPGQDDSVARASKWFEDSREPGGNGRGKADGEVDMLLMEEEQQQQQGYSMDDEDGYSDSEQGWQDDDDEGVGAEEIEEDEEEPEHTHVQATEKGLVQVGMGDGEGGASKDSNFGSMDMAWKS
ncbi:hypothetical protein BKA66DRAFT_244923 [Pyrenochaeta sp. MPI-SDFR-AT-0127]|nr:hypothetical protein BKA66DRAFT_244923 [Pyrenochaeta sp. MPI-SDFR-AT-0127]